MTLPILALTPEHAFNLALSDGDVVGIVATNGARTDVRVRVSDQPPPPVGPDPWDTTEDDSSR